MPLRGMCHTFSRVPVVSRNRTRVSPVIGNGSNHSTIEADVVMELETWGYYLPDVFFFVIFLVVGAILDLY